MDVVFQGTCHIPTRTPSDLTAINTTFVIPGNHYGIRRSTCDIRFYRNLKSTCNTISKVRNRSVCKAAAADYYSKVMLAGWIFFVKKSPNWCSEAYVKRCIR
ncbi:hypothetical protein MAR_035761 [Mya arenaria]|uniref:Uncharacterized protein n=1 Tax=Mya arenaria TaxID=6604 RepID=A0ABY7EL21_MYAAR|nr:hypothetical protein MAR_035761 [Mya arenaria]